MAKDCCGLMSHWGRRGKVSKVSENTRRLLPTTTRMAVGRYGSSGTCTNMVAVGRVQIWYQWGMYIYGSSGACTNMVAVGHVQIW